jgi:alkanesulfonate monooxygenase SsuD/methylene tetrahydromethanopterin reductase-like flavin-dependent oxidoreductase (luciferase family)
VLDAYRAAWDPAAGEPVAGLSRHVLVCDGDDEALAVAREAHATWFASMMRLWHERGDHSWDDMFSWEAATTHGTFVLGSPQTVRDRLAEALALSGANHLNLVFSWGSLTHERQRRSLELFAREVMPALAGAGAPAG